MSENGVDVTYDGTEDFFKSIATLAGFQVLVGIPASTGRSGSPISNAALGYIHENGSPARNIPKRPFLQPTMDRLRDQATAMLQRAAQFFLSHDPQQAMNTLNALGLLGATEVKKTIVAGGFEPLKPATLRARVRRGNIGTKPLIDTGQLLASITYVVRHT